ncbi:MAG: GNAT family N-acetyltransferase [Candidatus Eremiobacteraeota bacterium]|nr:GNAT family N-acetyltransferase [Candidatus Eremiobacteraeota bacterium]
MLREAPVLITQRLILRPHRTGDFEGLAALWADPAVTRFIGEPSTRQRSWARLLNYAGLWPLLGFGYWAIEERDTGTYVGDIGCADFKREIEPSIAGIPEFGWALAVAAHGKGYASEALAECFRWCDAHMKSKRAVCIMDPENTASVRVALKAGFSEYARTDYMGGPTLMYERFAP